MWQHNYEKNPLGSKGFIGLVNVFKDSDSPFRTRQSRAIEEFMFKYGPNKENVIHSIDPKNKYYDDIMLWAAKTINSYLESKHIRRE